jgi:hypothetical protein
MQSSLINNLKEQVTLDDLVDLMNASNFDVSSVTDIGAAKFKKNLW